jgi:ATP-binding cassette subfamily C (CFTR/MRP) protein 2
MLHPILSHTFAAYVRCAQKCLPIYTSSLFSRLTLWWMNDLMSLGYRQALTSRDVWRLNPQDKALNLYRKYQCKTGLRFRFNLPFTSKSFGSSDDTNAIKYEQNHLRHHHHHHHASKASPLPISIISSKRPNETRSVGKSLLHSFLYFFWPEIIMNAIYRLIALLIGFINPVLLKGLIRHLESGGSFFEGTPFVLGFIAVALASSLFSNQYEVHMLILNIRMRAVLNLILYNKVLSISPAGSFSQFGIRSFHCSHSSSPLPCLVRQDFTNGEILNLLSSDADRLADYTPTFNQTWATTIQILISLLMLYNEIGIASVGAVFVGILIIPINAIVMTRTKKMQKELLTRKDNRIKILSEILSNVKVLKFYAWEESFQKLILAIRATELVMLRKRLKYMAYTVFTYSLIPFLVRIDCCG